MAEVISQFTDKPVLAALLNALGEEMDELDKAFADLAQKRWIDTGSGVQLDGIGQIVGRDRVIANAVALPFFGFFGQPSALGFEEGVFRDSGQAWQASTTLGDAQYRFILWAKVFKNTSQCTQEDTVQSLRYVFDAENAVVEDAGNAKIRVGVGARLSPADLVLMKAYNLLIRGGGIGLLYAVQYESGNYFGFQGQPRAKGFDEGTFADMIDL